jgi:hypothetical protein
MKIFWALIGVLTLATVALLASGKLSGSSADPVMSPVSKPQPSALPAPAPQPKSEAPKPVLPPPLPIVQKAPTLDAPIAQPSTTEPAAVPIAPAAATTQIPATEVIAQPAATSAAPQPDEKTAAKPAELAKPEVEPKPAAPAPTPEESPLAKLRKEFEAAQAADAAKAAAKPAVPELAPATAPQTAAGADAGSQLFGDAKAELKPDGSLLIDGKYVVKGKGTKADPYKVTWDQLVSAQNEYAPKEGKKTIPARVTALNDKWVDITGYVAFPLMSTESDELLSMMNQWDGCCIGIPPTPYDAIEVRLASAVSGNARLTTYGSISGKFKVDAHLVGGWLVGLYVMDDAKLTPVSYGGIAP